MNRNLIRTTAVGLLALSLFFAPLADACDCKKNRDGRGPLPPNHAELHRPHPLDGEGFKERARRFDAEKFRRPDLKRGEAGALNRPCPCGREHTVADHKREMGQARDGEGPMKPRGERLRQKRGGECTCEKGDRGNNGVGNGEDPQPPGNPPVNDGPGTGPGSPGRKLSNWF